MTASCSLRLSSLNVLMTAIVDAVSGLSPRLTIASRKDEAVPSWISLVLLNIENISSSDKGWIGLWSKVSRGALGA